ncbi:MAG: cyclase family protein, partial [Pseudomonadota bacterium]|nr:cyclase family protein [Pseudomonadota bacterium]
MLNSRAAMVLPLVTIGMFAMAASETIAQTAGQRAAVEQSKSKVAMPPWVAGDQRGMGNTQGAGTWQRCAFHLSQPGAKSYEISHV